MSTVPESYGDKMQMSLICEACVIFFPTWSLNFEIADTCMHCIPIFYFISKTHNTHQSPYTGFLILQQNKADNKL